MVLETLSIVNFGPFRGKHEIRFATPRDNPQGNVTVIRGGSGRGKTAIVRALLFGLFGEKPELGLVNRHELKSESTEPGTPVAASVEIRFSHNEETFTLRRSLQAFLVKGRIVEDVVEAQLAVSRADGSKTTIEDPGQIAAVVNAVVHPSVREYFFLDGERAENLTRPTPDEHLSAGERQIRTLSFIAVQAKAACREGRELPLVMDSPFAVIDLPSRSDLVGEIARSCSQWVLLASGTELTRDQGKLLLDGGRWGRSYVLRDSTDGGTFVEEVPTTCSTS